jgi:hypothetical protein
MKLLLLILLNIIAITYVIDILNKKKSNDEENINADD